MYDDSIKKLVMGGEGSGKSYTGGLYATGRAIDDSLYTPKQLYWVVGQDFEDARRDAQYIMEFNEQLGNLDAKKTSWPASRDQQCVIVTKTGATFVTISAYDYTKLGREEPDGIIGAEVSRWIGEEAFSRCEGRLVRKYPRAWGYFSGSFETSFGWLPDLFKLGEGPNERGIRSFSVPSWVNRTKYPLGEDDPAIQMARAANSPQKFMERFGGKPMPPRGIIFGEFKRYLHVDDRLDYEPHVAVHLAIDPGDKVYCVLFLQFVGDEVWVLDEVYETHWTHQQVIQESMSKPGWTLVRDGTIDVAAKQAHMGMQRPIEQWLNDTGLSLFTAYHHEEDTIERIRVVLSNNQRTGRARLRIHPRCKGLISEMGGGPSPVDGGGPWMRVEHRDGFGPPKKQNDHACKALSYALATKYVMPQMSDKSDSSSSYLRRQR